MIIRSWHSDFFLGRLVRGGVRSFARQLRNAKTALPDIESGAILVLFLLKFLYSYFFAVALLLFRTLSRLNTGNLRYFFGIIRGLFIV